MTLTGPTDWPHAIDMLKSMANKTIIIRLIIPPNVFMVDLLSLGWCEKILECPPPKKKDDIPQLLSVLTRSSQ